MLIGTDGLTATTAKCDDQQNDPEVNQSGDFLLLKQLELNDFTTDDISTTNRFILMSPDNNNDYSHQIDDDNTMIIGNNHCTNFNSVSMNTMTAGSNSLSSAVSNTNVPSSGASSGFAGEQEVRVLTLAEQIIAAMPERIKNESEEMMLLLSSNNNNSNNHNNNLSSHSSNSSLSAVEVMSTEPVTSIPLMDEVVTHNHHGQTSSISSPSYCYDTTNDTATSFAFDHNYRYYDVATPSSSLSPASSSCLPSPSTSSFALPDSPSPPPTTADFCEFFHAGSSNSLFFEKDFSNLTLSDREQRELYEAAKIIQKAYRSYKGRKKLEEQDKERAAAVLIQNYYRRYKQYAYFKQMTKAAMVIQNGFRSYCEHKRFKKNQLAETEAALRIQNYYRSYREQTGIPTPSDNNNNSSCNIGNTVTSNNNGTSNSGLSSGNTAPPNGLKRTYSQRRQHQAARKIQQFMRQSKNKLQKERAEKEKRVSLCQ